MHMSFQNLLPHCLVGLKNDNNGQNYGLLLLLYCAAPNSTRKVSHSRGIFYRQALDRHEACALNVLISSRINLGAVWKPIARPDTGD